MAGAVGYIASKNVVWRDGGLENWMITNPLDDDAKAPSEPQSSASRIGCLLAPKGRRPHELNGY